MRITTEDSPFSFLSQRLSYAAQNGLEALNLVENVPSWPAGSRPNLPEATTEAYHYAPSEGDELLLAAVSSRENANASTAFTKGVGPTPREIDSRHILITNGATQAISLIVKNLPKNRSNIICQSPVFVGIPRIMESNGFNITYLDGDNKFAECLKPLVSSDTAAIYLNTPNNPTGRVLSALEILTIVDLALQYKIKVIIDSVYEDFAFDGCTPFLPRDPESDNVLLVNSVSKNYSAPGLRIGWIVGNASNIRALGGYQEQECVAVNGLAQHQAVALIAGSNTPLVDHVGRSRQVIYERLASIPGVAFLPSSAGTQLLVKLNVDDVEAFADFAVLEHGLIVATARNYAAIDANTIRVPLGLPLDTILKSLDVLTNALIDYRSAA